VVVVVVVTMELGAGSWSSSGSWSCWAECGIHGRSTRCKFPSWPSTICCYYYTTVS
jgi:hypothetical protein